LSKRKDFQEGYDISIKNLEKAAINGNESDMEHYRCYVNTYKFLLEEADKIKEECYPDKPI
jgi:hypothetical protein